MNLKETFNKHTHIIFGVIVIALIIFFNVQMIFMKSDFQDTLTDTKAKFSEELVNAMTKREHQINRLQAGISQDNLRRWDIIAVDKIIKQVNKNIPNETSYQYATYIVDEVNRHGNIDLLVWLSLLTQESRFRVDAESDKDAVGLGQIIPETARWICKELGVPYTNKIRLDPKMNLKMSAWYLSFLLNEYDGDQELALAHYNGGPWQKNSWKYTRMYKHSAEYKSMEVDELRVKLHEMKKEIPYDELKEMKSERAKEYDKYRKVYRAKRLVPETAAYVPEIMARAKEFEKFYNDPNSVVNAPLKKDSEEMEETD